MIFGREYDFSLIRTTSKEALLRSALLVSNNDIRKATEIVEYFTKQLPNLPDTDPAPLSALDQVDAFASRLSAWGEKHPDITNGLGNILMQVLKNSKLGAFLQPAAGAATEVPAAPLV